MLLYHPGGEEHFSDSTIITQQYAPTHVTILISNCGSVRYFRVVGLNEEHVC